MVHAPVAQVGHIIAVCFNELAAVELVRLQACAVPRLILPGQAAGVVAGSLHGQCAVTRGLPHLADVAQVVAAVIIVTVALRHVAFRVVDAGLGQRQGAFARVLVVSVFVLVVDAVRVERAAPLAQQDGPGGERAVHHHGHHLDAEEGGVVRLPLPPGSVVQVRDVLPPGEGDAVRQVQQVVADGHNVAVARYVTCKSNDGSDKETE